MSATPSTGEVANLSLEELAYKLCELVFAHKRALLASIPPNYRFFNNEGKPTLRGMDMMTAKQIILRCWNRPDYLLTFVQSSQMDKERTDFCVMYAGNPRTDAMLTEFGKMYEELQNHPFFKKSGKNSLKFVRDNSPVYDSDDDSE